MRTGGSNRRTGSKALIAFLAISFAVATVTALQPTGHASADPFEPLNGPSVQLTQAEKDFLDQKGNITMLIDPDWEPYELVTEDGEFIGIAADLLDLIAERIGINLELVPTDDWPHTLEKAEAGEADMVGFLTQTPQREEFMIFTEVYFSDPVVFITREEHEFITNPAALSDVTVALPEGTSIEQRLNQDYPDFNIVTTEREADVFQMIEDREADMTLRSLTMAAYNIKAGGWFNLKIAGQYPDYDNDFRIGVLNNQTILVDILNKGIATLTPQEVQEIVNQHISIEFILGTERDYGPLISIALISVLIIGFTLFWNHQLRRFNSEMAESEAALKSMGERLASDNEALSQAHSALEQANRKLNILSSITRHDILNQLMVIQGYLDLSGDSEGSGLPKPYLDRMGTAARSIQNQIEFTRQYEQLGVRDPVWTSISGLIGEIATGEMPVNDGCGGLEVYADLMLKKVFFNLYENTLRHAKGATRIDVRCRREGDDIIISWEDDGPGIPDGMKSDIFERGFGNNTGFGLFLTREILAITGITLTENGRHGEGARFEMTVPGRMCRFSGDAA